MNYRLIRKALAVSDIVGECRRTDLCPAFGLTSPPSAEMDVPSTWSILMPSALMFVAALPSR